MEFNSCHILHKVIVIGVSTGGVKALKTLLSGLNSDFPLPILVVSHIIPEADDGLPLLMDTFTSLRVKEADEGEILNAATVYFAPANYHLLVESGGKISLSVDPPVNFARPSIDVLFESAAITYGCSLIGVVLTGAGIDGSKGLEYIQKAGGITIVQNPEDAEMSSMPTSALRTVHPDFICSLHEMPALFWRLAGEY